MLHLTLLYSAERDLWRDVAVKYGNTVCMLCYATLCYTTLLYFTVLYSSLFCSTLIDKYYVVLCFIL